MIQPGPGRNLVWLASYPRSGNTWARFFLHNLIEIMTGKDNGGDINDINQYSEWEAAWKHFERVLGPDFRGDDYKLIFQTRLKAQAALSQIAGGPSLIKTHLAILSASGTSTINPAVTAGGIYFVRNPLDIAVSLASHLGKTLDQAIDFMADPEALLVSRKPKSNVFEPLATWSVNVESWTDRPSPALLVIRYEDMHATPKETFRRIANHLRMQPTDAQIDSAIERAKFTRAQQQEQTRGYTVEKAGGELFFRQGKAGGWREALDQQQIERIVASHEPQMRRFGYWPNSALDPVS